MDQQLNDRLTQLEQKLDNVYKSVESARKMFLITLIITIATIVVPLIALIFIIPWILETFTKMYSF